MFRKLSRFAPPGYNLREELGYYLIFILGGLLISFKFFFRFNEAYNNLFGFENNLKVLLPDAIMPNFEILASNVFSGFRNYFLSLYFLWQHYAYHKKETMSIYLMKRLPKSWERHFRCWALPVMLFLLGILLTMLLRGLYFLFYLKIVPLSVWPPDQTLNLWSVIL
jgi:hypothetical protein